MKQRCKQGYPQDTCNVDGFRCPSLSREGQEKCMLYEANTSDTEEMKKQNDK